VFVCSTFDFFSATSFTDVSSKLVSPQYRLVSMKLTNDTEGFFIGWIPLIKSDYNRLTARWDGFSYPLIWL
jgi:hypothetical protein